MKYIALIMTLAGFLVCGHALAGDGWTYYNTENSGIASDTITCMKAAPDGSMWFGHGDGKGISVFDGENWTVMYPYLSGENYSIDDIVFVKDVVWGASKSGLFRYNEGSWETIFEDLSVNGITSDIDGNIWICGRLSPHDTEREAVSLYNGENWTTWFVGEVANTLAVDKNNNLWFNSTGNGLYSFDGQIWKHYRYLDGIHDNASIYNIVVTESGDLWFCSEYGVFIYDGKTLKKTNLYGSDIAFGMNDIVWLSGNATIAYYAEKPESVYELELTIGNNRFIESDNNGSIWFAGNDIVVAQYSGQPYPIEEGWPFEFHVDNEIQEPFAGHEASERKIDGYFPLAAGNTWVYHRTFKPGFSDSEYEDTVIMTVIDACENNGKTEYEFLDGRVYVVNENDTIENPGYELRPCGEIECDSNGTFYQIYQQRDEDSIITKVGVFQGYRYRIGGFLGSVHFLAPSVGLVAWSLITDIPEHELLQLESAYVNGVEIGLPDEIESTPAPEPLSLSAPFPNPFNASTTIEFTLSEPGETALTAYTITGQKVRTLLSGGLAAGKYAVVWDGADDIGQTVSSGVYLLRLESDGHAATARLAFVK